MPLDDAFLPVNVRPERACARDALVCADMPARAFSEDATVPIVAKLAAVDLPQHALIEADFTPIGPQTENATVFNNEAVPHSFRGFRFQTVGGDQYRLVLGLGTSWVFSKSVLLPRGKRAAVTIEFDDNDVYLRANGVGFDSIHMPSRMANTPGSVMVGSWIHGYCPFAGTIHFFEIRDLRKT